MFPKEKDKLKEDYAREYRDVVTHTRGLKPEHILGVQRPYESEEVRAYRLSVYEPITQYVFLNGINDILRVVRNSNASFQMLEGVERFVSDTFFEEFFWEKYAVFNLEDANGALIFLPHFIALNQPVSIDPVLVHSSQIEARTPELFIYWEVPEKVYILIDTEKVVRGEVIEDEKVIETVLYNHNFGFLPVLNNKGILVRNEDGEEYNKSFLSPTTAWGNKVIMADSDHTATQTLYGSPMREIEEMPCSNLHCKKGYVFDPKTNDRHICGTCDGKGVFIPSGAFAYIIRKRANAALGEQQNTKKAIEYITPPVGIVPEQREGLIYLFDQLEKSLSQITTNLAQSAVAKREDRQQKQSMLDRIGTSLMNTYKGALQIIQGYIFRDMQTPVKMTLPPTFAEISEESIKAGLQELRASGTPQIIVEASVKEWIKYRFGSNESTTKIIDVLEMIDPLYTFTFEEKQQMLVSGRATEEEIMQSDKYPFLAKIAIHEDEANSKTVGEIAARVNELYNERYPNLRQPLRNENGEVI